MGVVALGPGVYRIPTAGDFINSFAFIEADGSVTLVDTGTRFATKRIVNGLAAMRNKMSDAHAASYRPDRHHAKLAVYAATTLADFLFETKSYQHQRGALNRSPTRRES